MKRRNKKSLIKLQLNQTSKDYKIIACIVILSEILHKRHKTKKKNGGKYER